MSKVLFQSELIKAGAGTGKTYRLIQKVVQLFDVSLKNYNKAPRLIVCTFTKKASQELKQRLFEKAIQQINLSDNSPPQETDLKFLHYLSSPSLQIATIDGILYQFLKKYGDAIHLSPDFQISYDSLNSTLFDSFSESFIYERHFSLLKKMTYPQMKKLFLSYYKYRIHQGPLSFYDKRDFQDFQKERDALIDCKKFASKNLFNQYLGANQKSLLRYVDYDKAKKLIMSQPESFDSDQFVSLFEEFKDSAEDFFLEFLEKKKNSQFLAIEDILLFSYYLLDKESGIADSFNKEWDYWLIDEYQDTSSLQERVIDKITNFKNVFCVGDFGQSIYSFRGADPDIFKKRERQLQTQGNRVEQLKQNRRSSPALISFYNDFFASDAFMHFESSSDREASFDKETSSNKETSSDKSCVSFFTYDLSKKDIFVLPALSNYIEWLKNEKGADYNEIAVLSSNNKDLVMIASYLRKRNLPLMLYSSNKFSEKRQILDSLFLIKFLINPYDDENLKALLRTPYFRLSDQELADSSYEYSQSLKGDTDLQGVSVNLPDGANLKGGENLQSGANLKGGENLQSGANLKGGENLQSGANLKGGENLQSGANLKGGENLQSGANLKGGENLQSGANLKGGENLQSGANLSGGANLQDDVITLNPFEESAEGSGCRQKSKSSYDCFWFFIREKYREEYFVEALSSYLNNYKQKGLFESFKQALFDSGIMDLSHFQDPTSSSLANLWKLLALLKKNKSSDLKLFYKLMEDEMEDEGLEEALASEGSRFIELMTIHKSKGLQFKHVIILDLSIAVSSLRMGNKEESTSLYDPVRKKMSFSVPIGGRNKSKVRPYGHKLCDVFREQNEIKERDRLFYVAMTRAEESLALFIPHNKNPEQNSWLKNVSYLKQIKKLLFIEKDKGKILTYRLNSGKYKQKGYCLTVMSCQELNNQHSYSQGFSSESSDVKDTASRPVAVGDDRVSESADLENITSKTESPKAGNYVEDLQLKKNLTTANDSPAQVKGVLFKSSQDFIQDTIPLLIESHSKAFHTRDHIKNTLFKAQLGSNLHFFLQKLSYFSYSELKTLIDLQDNKNSQFVKQALEYILKLKNPALSVFFRKGFSEWAFKFKRQNIVLQGRIDLWFRDNSTLHVVDYKSSLSEQTRKQLIFYSWVLNEMYHPGQIFMYECYPLQRKTLKTLFSSEDKKEFESWINQKIITGLNGSKADDQL